MSDLSPADKFELDLKVTAGCRFNAAARLDAQEKRSNILTSIYSALLICISIATFSLPLDSNLIKYASFGGIVASILLLVMSMRNFAHKFGVEADQMHRCALEINELRRVWRALNESDKSEKIIEFSEKYNRILQRWNLNHNEADYLNYKYKHKWEFSDISDVADDKLPDRKFKELYETSAGGVALATMIGIIFIGFIGYILWDSISEPTYDNELEIANRAEQNAQDAMNAAINSLANINSPAGNKGK